MEKAINKFVPHEIKELQKDIHKGFERVEKKVVEVDIKLGKKISEVATSVEVLDKSTKEIFGHIQRDMRETRTDIESLKVMSANHFAETMSRFDKVTTY